MLQQLHLTSFLQIKFPPIKYAPLHHLDLNVTLQSRIFLQCQFRYSSPCLSQSHIIIEGYLIFKCDTRLPFIKCGLPFFLLLQIFLLPIDVNRHYLDQKKRQARINFLPQEDCRLPSGCGINWRVFWDLWAAFRSSDLQQ